ncbi:hypothetical protein N9X65_06200 [Porticoccaceae bacterium]|nr:hypothetical protein [Porticoccaceae bacterium]
MHKALFILILLTPSILIELPALGHITVAELLSIGFVFFGVMQNKKLQISIVFYTIFLLACTLLVSNAALLLNLQDFSLSSAAKSFLRLGLLMLATGYCTSRFQCKDEAVDHVYSIIKIALLFHAVILLFDLILPSPIYWTETTRLGFGHDLSRPRGLFGEPSFYGYYTLLLYSALLSLQPSHKMKLTTFQHVLYIGSVIACGSLSAYFGLGLLGLFFLILHSREKASYKLPTLSGKSLLLSMLLVISVAPLLVSPIEYISSRGAEIFVDGSIDVSGDSSTRTRLLGSVLVSEKILTDNLWLGAGLGGDNFRNLYSQSGDYLELLSVSDQNCVGTGECSATLGWGAFTFWSYLLVAGGLPSLVLFYGALVAFYRSNKNIRIFIFTVFVLSNFKAQLFDPFLWILLATVVTVHQTSKLSERRRI